MTFIKQEMKGKVLSRNKHPLLITRGVPGTHDVDMIFSFFKKN